ncbi:MAG TPA: hypothetical protein VK272_04180 [Solirubrobacteraceae bacterium]|nr:hypothetical protein [Solirubrobacteraceae bacterium]
MSSPQPTREVPDAGVIDDARTRQRRRRGRIAGLSLVALAIAAAIVAGGGSGDGGQRGGRTTVGSSPYTSVGSGISVRYPHGWHLLRPPITSLAYPHDRMLLTSYPVAAGGDCGPTRAENALPSNGALIYLSEYTTLPGSVFGSPTGMEFPPQSAGFKLERRDLGNYECSTVPSYLIRFRASGRLFQVTLAFGAHAAASLRARATRILDDLRIQPTVS